MSSSVFKRAVQDCKNRAGAARSITLRKATGIDSGGIRRAAVGQQQMGMLGGGDSGYYFKQFKNWVYVALGVICRRVMAQPACAGVMAGKAPDKRSLDQLRYKQQMLARVPEYMFAKAANPKFEIVDDHPALDVMERPSTIQSKSQFLYMRTANLFLSGEAYVVGGMNKDLERPEMYAVPSPWITPVHDSDLFTSFILKKPGETEGTPLEASQVSRVYFPDPEDLKGCISPIETQFRAVKIDDRIQESQYQAFDNGIFPKMAVRVGGLPGPDGVVRKGQNLPVLTRPQRRMLQGAVDQVMKGMDNYGGYAVLDGLIEDIYRISSTPAEMDWLNSGEQVKDRIFQAMGVYDLMVGGKADVGGYAQASVMMQLFLDNVVNPVLQSFSDADTPFLSAMFEQEGQLYLWWEEAKPKNAELKQKQWEKAIDKDLVDESEYRTEILGLPPRESKVQESALLKTVGGMTGTLNIQRAVGAGELSVDAGVNTVMKFLKISRADAEGMFAGMGFVMPGSDDPPSPAADDEPEPDEELDELPDGDEETPAPSSSGDGDGAPAGDAPPDDSPPAEPPAPGESSHPPRRKSMQRKIVRGIAKALHIKQVDHHEATMAAAFARLIKRQVKSASAKLATVGGDLSNVDVDTLVDSIFDPKEWDEELEKTARATIGEAMAEGALAELALFESSRGKAIDPDYGIPTTLPEWLREVIGLEFDEVFSQDYWQDINRTTRTRMRSLLETGIDEGLSIRDLASLISETLGGVYSIHRATAIARTEVGSALNAGHRAGIDRIGEETGIDTRSEWLSVLGTTTRHSHANLDGTVSGEDGNFELGGVRIPYPGHYLLPVGERANCQCTVTMAFVDSDGTVI